jgi:hypothetical protein
MNGPAPETEAFQTGPKNQTGESLKNGSNNFDEILVDYVDRLPK